MNKYRYKIKDKTIIIYSPYGGTIYTIEIAELPEEIKKQEIYLEILKEIQHRVNNAPPAQSKS